MVVSLVTFTLAPQRYSAPTLEALGPGELWAFVRAVARGERPRFAWPWREGALESDDGEPEAWLAERTRSDALALSIDGPLAQCAAWEEGSLVARYLFDHEYALAHPEATDLVHLSIAHGTIAAKIFDEGVLVLTEDGARASLRWRSARAKGTRLGPHGAKERTSRAGGPR